MEKIQLAIEILSKHLSVRVCLRVFINGGVFINADTNGVLELNGKNLFFKNHIELNKLLDNILTIEEEYYSIGDVILISTQKLFSNDPELMIKEKCILCIIDGFALLISLTTGTLRNKGVYIGDQLSISREEMNQVVETYTTWEKIPKDS